jgi:hypothetical protein
VRRFRAAAALLRQAGLDHLLLDVVELTLGHAAARKAAGHAGKPCHPTGGAGLVSTQGCLGHAGSNSVALGAEFLGAAVWRGVWTVRLMGLGAVAVFNFSCCGGDAGRQVDQIRAHVGCFAWGGNAVWLELKIMRQCKHVDS